VRARCSAAFLAARPFLGSRIQGGCHSEDTSMQNMELIAKRRARLTQANQIINGSCQAEREVVHIAAAAVRGIDRAV